MAAHIGQPIRSRRFIKIYLSVWALLAVAALAFLAMLAFQPQAFAPPSQQTEPERPKSGPAESKALAEVRSIRGSLTEIRKDVSQLQEAVGERVVNEKVTHTRLTALEERVSTIDQQQPQQPAAAPAPKAPDKTARNAPDPNPGEAPAAQPETPAPPPFMPVETGSLGKEKIVFGEAVVTPAGKAEFAVQLAAGNSLQALRQSWGQLAERHAGALGTLQPRVVAPRSEGGLYRLLAGPVPTKADAERICAALGIGHKACFATTYIGAPL